MFYDLKALSQIQDELGDASSIFEELPLDWISSITQLRQFICRIRTSLMYRSVLRDNPDCGRAQHCRHRASGIQDEGEIQLRVQLAHVGNNNTVKKCQRPFKSSPFCHNLPSRTSSRAHSTSDKPPMSLLLTAYLWTTKGSTFFSTRSIVAKKNGGLKWGQPLAHWRPRMWLADR